MTNTSKNAQKHEKLATLKLPLLPYLTPIGQGHEKKTILERGRNDVAPIQVYLKGHGATYTHTNGDPSVAMFWHVSKIPEISWTFLSRVALPSTHL